MDPDPAPRRVAGAAVNGDRQPEQRTAGSVDPLRLLGAVRVLPVVTIDDSDVTVPLITALVGGGLTVVEITMRTPAALDAIRRAVSEVPAAVIGAGTVTTIDTAVAVMAAGARFIVSPGLDARVVETARERGVPVIPGIATPTEMMRAAALDLDVVKLFPAELVGGSAMITALSAVWPLARFVPTGGISQASAPSYLALPQVLAVGGSWMVPRAAVAGRDWSSVEDAAATARRLAERVG
jgi:2-dehydro-3-deoxyphosphogluconate aldolase / (4S)-4-hydroxy-2-oxoglutarate aldolase